ncbi:LamG-like jellyroll fold domain-containing protein [Massiliimalia massiliensis]|uniref:LamG-like jellyroll fold domain-containing protein n=1 Tax=Massiliimalia massiliensis TaxID=1852384 RepID=UPI0009842987|nr:LamG-like jellyroll fold domain-containing protein [Massiliimalia massiliensis]
MKGKIKRLTSLCLVAILTTASLSISIPTVKAASVEVNVNFSLVADYPLVKNKVSPFNSGYVGEERWLRDMYLADELNINSFRYETGWGMGEGVDALNNNFAYRHELGAPQIFGSVDNLQYNFSIMDHITDALNLGGMNPMYIHGYSPQVLQSGDSFTSKPNNMNAWKQVNKAFAQHWKDTGRNVGFYEIWNEPDLVPIFFTGSKEDYFEIYQYGAQGVKEGDSDAKVGGPVLAFTSDWTPDFLNYVSQNNLPLDFLSFHKFGFPQDTVPVYRNYLDGAFFTTELILSEYNSYQPGVQYPDFHQDGAVDTNKAAYMLLHDFNYFMQQPDLTKVYWAQFNDPEVFGDTADRCGMINNDGRRKAVFNAYKIYGDMPVDRKQLTISDSAIEGMASADSHKAAVVLWNMFETDKSVDVSLDGIPFSQGTLKVQRIDTQNANYNVNPQSENLQVTESRTNISTSGLTWSGTVPGMSVVYLTVEDGTFLTDDSKKDIATVVQTNHYFFERSKSNYATFDENTWTARLGMVNEEFADSLVGVTVEDLPDSFHVNCEVNGTLQDKDNNSLLGIRIDYMVNGSYQKGVLFHGGLYHSNRESKLPWGTMQLPDQVVQVSNFSDFSINPADYAPAGWNNGRVIISFEQQNAGKNTQAKFSINKASAPEKELINWYTMEDNGYFANDKTGNGFNAQLYGGATFTDEGLTGKAMIFNGDSAYADFANKVENDFTISFWMKTTQTGGTGPWYYGKGLVDGENPGVTNDFGVSLLGDRLAFGVGNPDTTIYSQTPVNDGAWHLCTVTRQQSNGKMKLYIDGELEATGTGSTQALDTVTTLNLGRIQTGSNYYEGLLDDVRIYNYLIPEGLIQELSGDKFLNGQYHFDSVSNTKAIDSSNKQNDINLYGNVATIVGQKGKALTFDGSSYGTLTRNIADDFTIGFWVKTTQTMSGTQWYEGAGLLDGECPEVTNDFGVSLLDGKLAFGTGRPDVTIKSNTSINDGNWHYCTVTRERPSGKMSLYVDGIKEAETIGGKKSLYTPLELDVGRIHNSTTNYFKGSMDELVIYNRAFSDNEVKALANGELK